MAWFNHPSVEVLTKQHDKLKKSEDVADKIAVFFGIAMFIGFLIMITSIITDGFDSDGILIGIMVCLLGGVVFYVFLKVSDSFGKKANLIQKKKKYKKFCTKTAPKQLIAKMTNRKLHICIVP